MTFDADSHVEESAQTWKYLDEKFARRGPIPITLEDQPALLGQNSFWLIDGAVVPRTSGKGLSLFGTPATSLHAREKPFSIGSQELTHMEARIRDLDKFGIDTQIINSTLLNATSRPTSNSSMPSAAPTIPGFMKSASKAPAGSGGTPCSG